MDNFGSRWNGIGSRWNGILWIKVAAGTVSVAAGTVLWTTCFPVKSHSFSQNLLAFLYSSYSFRLLYMYGVTVADSDVEPLPQRRVCGLKLPEGTT